MASVLLPSGFRVRGILPGLDILAQRGLLDERALAAVVKLADQKYLADAAPADIAGNLQTWLDVLVAGFPREAQDPDADHETADWKPVNLTVADLETMDQRDRDLLEDLVLHRRTADEVTALASAAIYATGAPEEVPGLDGLAEFRDGMERPAGGADGAGLGPAAVDPPGDG